MADSWLEGLEIDLVCGDVIEQAVDALLCPVRVDLRYYGAISRKVYGLGGQAFNILLREKMQSMQKQRIDLGSSVSLDVSAVGDLNPFTHVILVALWSHDNQYTPALFYAAYISAIRTAARCGCRSLAMPIMAYDCNLLMARESWVKAMIDLGALEVAKDWNLNLLKVCSTNQHHVDQFELAVGQVYRYG